MNQIQQSQMKISKVEALEELTPLPSGKHRQKKSGRGRPTASLIASVITPVMSTEYRRPEYASQPFKHNCHRSTQSKWQVRDLLKQQNKKIYLVWHGADHIHHV